MARRVRAGIAGGTVVTGLQTFNTTVTTANNLDIIIDPTGTGKFLVTSDAQLQNQSDLRFADGDSSNWIGFQAPNVVAQNVLWTLPGIDGDDEQVLTTNGSGTLSWAAPKGFKYSFVANNFNAVPSIGYFVNTTSTSITATLPASPATGDTIRFIDIAKTFDSNALVINRNGQLIMGDADNLTVNTESASFELIFSNSTFGWRIFSI